MADKKRAKMKENLSVEFLLSSVYSVRACKHHRSARFVYLILRSWRGRHHRHQRLTVGGSCSGIWNTGIKTFKRFLKNVLIIDRLKAVGRKKGSRGIIRIKR